MIRISPQQFRDAFSQCATIYSARIAAYWDHSKDYTKFIRETFLRDIAKKLALEIYPADYYTLDAIFYEAKDVAHFDPVTTYAKYIAVAIEHENDARSTYVEMNKLQLLNTPLKVLITYNSGTDHDHQLNRLLGEYATIVREADVFADIATMRRMLLIVGEKPADLPKWRYYTFNGETFETLA